jgi:aliphatic nitrilase
MTLELPRFTAAAVQAAPVFLDASATIDKTRALIEEAAGNGARLVVFPEVFVPGYPYWNWTMKPTAGSAWFERLVRQSVTVPGPEISAVEEVARAHDVTVVLGVDERPATSVGTLYNTIVTIDGAHGTVGVHRKLVPTWAEKLTWAGGDGSSLVVHDTAAGRLGVLACGENTNPLARFTLLARGEQVHAASYIALPVAPPDYDMAHAIALRSAAHSFEGKVFTVVATSVISDEIVDQVAGGDEAVREQLRRPRSALSGIFGPDGEPVVPPLVDAEGIVYAEIDLARCIQPRQMHDVTGGYNRFDVFSLTVNGARLEPLHDSPHHPGADWAPVPPEES